MNLSATPLFRERPASRLTVVEAFSTLPFAVMVLPYSSPENRTAPDWAQLLGLAMIITLYTATLYTWRLVMVSGLRPMTRQQLRDDRRLRLLVLGYPFLVALLLPVPDTWMTFWFWLTLISTAGGAVSLVRLVVMLKGQSTPATAPQPLRSRTP
ncbi:hypothetical protein [Nonomuraea sp. NPDC046570]|uniref:hypothetical protein n=1 Tax=Nonomuraea sp. NPDC046570 TaxID=3155255 RepID=UPI0033F04F04